MQVAPRFAATPMLKHQPVPQFAGFGDEGDVQASPSLGDDAFVPSTPQPAAAHSARTSSTARFGSGPVMEGVKESGRQHKSWLGAAPTKLALVVALLGLGGGAAVVSNWFGDNREACDGKNIVPQTGCLLSEVGSDIAGAWGSLMERHELPSERDGSAAG